MKLTEEAIRKERDLAAIKDWMRKQPHLPDEWESPFLLTFLRGCKYSLEKTKKKIDMYFTMRAACPEFFANRDITSPKLAEMVEKSRLPTMPGLTPEGRRVSIARGLDNTMEADRLTDAIKIVFMELDLRLREQTEDVKGEIYILDASVVRPSHLGTISLSMLKKFFICAQSPHHIHTVRQIIQKTQEYNQPLCLAFVDYEKAFDSIETWSVLESLQRCQVDWRYIQVMRCLYQTATMCVQVQNSQTSPIPLHRGEAYPVRLKEVHVVNAGSLVDALYNIAKPFLTEKLKKRIYFHKDYSNLLDFLPKNMLPEEYGGTGCTLLEAHQTTMKKLIDNRSWFKEQEAIKANEALRPGKPTNYSDLFGLDGSFRQLEID